MQHNSHHAILCDCPNHLLFDEWHSVSDHLKFHIYAEHHYLWKSCLYNILVEGWRNHIFSYWWWYLHIYKHNYKHFDRLFYWCDEGRHIHIQSSRRHWIICLCRGSLHPKHPEWLQHNRNNCSQCDCPLHLLFIWQPSICNLLPLHLHSIYHDMWESYIDIILINWYGSNIYIYWCWYIHICFINYQYIHC